MMRENDASAVSIEDLMAFADGELDADAQARVAVAIADDPDAQRIVEEMRAGRALLATAFQSVASEPVPRRLIDTIMAAPMPAQADPETQSNVIRLSDGAAARTPVDRAEHTRRPWTGNRMAIAASLAAVAALSTFQMARTLRAPSGAGIEGALAVARAADGQLLAVGALAQVLDTQASMELRNSTAAGYRPVLSFLGKSGDVCRQFEARAGAGGDAGIACRRADGAWRVELIAAGAATVRLEPGKVVPAGRTGSPELEALVDRMSAGDPFGREDELALIQTGWRRPAKLPGDR